MLNISNFKFFFKKSEYFFAHSMSKSKTKIDSVSLICVKTWKVKWAW